VGFEPAISAGERPQTYALVQEENGTGISNALDVATWPLSYCAIQRGIYLL